MLEVVTKVVTTGITLDSVYKAINTLHVNKCINDHGFTLLLLSFDAPAALTWDLWRAAMKLPSLWIPLLLLHFVTY